MPEPVNVTRSISSTRGVVTLFFTPPACQAHGRGLRSLKSLPVKTPTMPGSRAAFVVSMRLILAWAYELRSTAAWTIPGSWISSRYLASPVISRGSSRRLTLAPKSLVTAMSRPLLSCGSPHRRSRTGNDTRDCRDVLGLHLSSGIPDGVDDVLIAGAAAEVAFQAMTDVSLAGVGVPFEDLQGRQHHPRGAEATLQPVLLPEPLLDGMQPAVLGQPFHRDELGAVGLRGKHGTRLHRYAVH